MAIRIKARYENEMLKPLEKLELEEGEEVEIEVKKASVEEFHGKMRIDKEIADEIIEMEIWDKSSENYRPLKKYS